MSNALTGKQIQKKTDRFLGACMEGIFYLPWRETAIHVQGCRIGIEKTGVGSYL